MELLIFNEAEKLINAITPDTNNGALIEDKYTRELNGANTFEFKISASLPASADIVEKNKVGFFDIGGHLQVFEIVDVEEVHDDYQEKAIYCEHVSYELIDANRIGDARPTNATARHALNQALENTNWQVGTVADLGLSSTNFYRLAPREALQKIVEIWNGDLRFRLETGGHTITGRFVDLVWEGSNQGVGFEYGFNTTSVEKTTHIKQLKTALYGYGKGEETEGGGFGRRIGFADVEWSVANGDPVDKPLGQEWVGLPDALARNGRVQDGERAHRFGDFEDSEEENRELLLRKTYEALLLASEPVVNYKVSAVDYEQLVSQGEDFSHWKVRLGDTCFVIDREFKPALTVSTRVIKDVQSPFTDPNNRAFELGNFLDLYDDQDRLDDLEKRVNDRIGRIDNPKVDPGEVFPDAPTAVPTNVKATGLFQNIAVNWDMMQDSNIASYEVYAAQSPQLLGNPESLVFSGFTSGFLFEGELNRIYYFAVRSVNYHGRASALSTIASAQTALIMTDDILFGEELAEKLRELELIANDSIDLDKIKQEVFDQIERDRNRYTDQEIAHVENSLNQELRDRAKTEDVNREINRINKEVSDGKESLNKVAEDLQGMDEHFTSQFEVLETGLSGKISTGEVDRLLGDKVDLSVYDQRQADIDFSIDGFKTSFESANTRIDNVSGEIQAVEQRTTSIEASNEGFLIDINELKNQEIGGTNLITGTSKEFAVSDRTHTWGDWTSTESSNNIPVMPGETYTARIYLKSDEGNIKRVGIMARTREVGNNNSARTDFFGNWIRPGEEGYSTLTITIPNDRFFLTIYSIRFDSSTNSRSIIEFKELKLEKGHKATDWSPAPKDMVDFPTYSSRQTQLNTTIEGISGRIGDTESGIGGLRDTQAQFRLDLDGFSTSVRDIRTTLNGKVDTNTYTQRQTQLDSTINGISGRVSTTESGVSGLSSRVGTLELTDREFNTKISNIETGLGKKVNTEGYMTTATGTSLGGQWTRYARIELRAQYHQKYATFEFHGGHHSGAVGDYALMSIRVKQQLAIGSGNPQVEMALRDSKRNAGVNDFKAVLIQNGSGRVIVDFFLRVRDNHNAFSVNIYNEGGSATPASITLFSNQGFSPSVPSGTSWDASTDNTSLGRISKSETAIEQNAKDITLRSTEIGLIDGRMTMAEGRITTQAGEIALKVSRDGIVSAINLTPESAKIDTRLLQIGNFSNFIKDAEFENNLDVHHIHSGNWSVQNGGSTAKNSGKVLSLTQSNEESRIYLGGQRLLKVKEGEQYNFSIWARPGSSSPWNRIMLRFRYSTINGSFLSWSNAYYFSPGGFTYTKLSMHDIVPTNAYYLEVTLSVMNDGRSYVHHFQDPALNRKSDTQMIVDGAITANHMSANSITAGNAAIANAAITRANLQNAIITNAHIADATIQSAKIANVSADKINAGTIRGIDIIGVTITGSTIRSTNGNNNTEITGGSFTSTGRYTRTWRNSTETNTVTLRAFNGYFRAENPSKDRAVSFSDFGISTFADGNGGGSSSGTIEFFSRRYSNVNGLTMYSSGTFGVDADEIVSQSRFAHLIESNESQIYLRPNRTNRPGNNTFLFSVANESNASNTDGIMAYGSSENGYASGIRFSKAASNPTIYALDGNLNRWGSSRFEAGYFAGHMVMSHTGSNFYVGSSSEIRMVNSTAYINGNINYIDGRARRFIETSSRELKMDIIPYAGSGLGALRDLTVTNYYFKTDQEKNDLQIGLISEDSPYVASADGKGIETSKVTYLSLKAIQELDTKVEYIEDELSMLRIENQLMKKQIGELERKIA